MRTAGRAEYRLSFPRVIHSEWTKLRCLRSTWIVFGAVALLGVGVAAVAGWQAKWDVGGPTTEEAVGTALLAFDAVALVFGVFGVLMMTGEYGSGLIRASLAAVPRRLPVLWAKAIVLAATTAPFTMAIALASFLLNQALTDGTRIGLDDPGVLRALFGAATAGVLWVLLGLGVGTIVRHTAGALTTYVAVLLVIPALLGPALPDTAEDDVLPYTPTFAGQAMYEIDGSDTFPWILSPGAGALVLAAWSALVVAAGAAVLHSRDS